MGPLSSRKAGGSSCYRERQFNSDFVTPKYLTRQDFTPTQGDFVLSLDSGTQGRGAMESTFGNWRSAAVGLGLTVVVVGAGLAFAFL